MKRLLTLLAIIAIAINLSFAQGVKRKIVFQRGSNSATIEGNVIRGDRHEYTINARKNQKMRVSISSIENNAVFQIYLGTRTLEGASESEAATNWQGDLPRATKFTKSSSAAPAATPRTRSNWLSSTPLFKTAVQTTPTVKILWLF